LLVPQQVDRARREPRACFVSICVAGWRAATALTN